MRALLLLLCCVSAVAHAETWKWVVESSGGSRDRFLLFFQSDPPPRSTQARWTLTIDEPAADGTRVATLKVEHSNAPAEVRTFSIRTKNGVNVVSAAGLPLVKRRSPPRVLSMERVPCTAGFAPELRALCSGFAGGPLDQPEMPVEFTLSNGSLAHDVARASVAIFTLGALIPGENASYYAVLEAPAPRPLSGALLTWSTSDKSVAQLKHFPEALDAETAGALVVIAGRIDGELLEAITRRVPAMDRFSVLRLASVRSAPGEEVLKAIARLRAANALADAKTDELRALHESLFATLYGPTRRGAEGLLRDEFPQLQKVLAFSFGEAFEPALLDALEHAPLAPGEGGVLASLLTVSAREQNLPRFIERLPDDEAVEFVRAALGSNSAKTLNSVPAWVDRMVDSGKAEHLFEPIHTETELMAVFDGLLSRADDDQRPARLLFVMKRVSLDSTRMAMLEKWKSTPLTSTQRAQLIETFRGEREYIAAARALSDDATVAECIGAGAKSERVLLLLETFQPELDSLTAQRAFLRMQFDDKKLKAAPLLFTATTAADAPELLVAFAEDMLSDKERLELIRSAPPSARKLTKRQRVAILRTFHFEKEKARVLLQ